MIKAVLVIPGGYVLCRQVLGQWRQAFFEPRPSCVRHARHLERPWSSFRPKPDNPCV